MTKYKLNTLPKSTQQPVKVAGVLVAFWWLLTTGYVVVAQPQLPLFYSLPLDEQQLVAKGWLFLIPVLATLILVTHYLIMHALLEYFETIQNLFGWSTVVIQVLLGLSLLRIIYITI